MDDAPPQFAASDKPLEDATGAHGGPAIRRLATAVVAVARRPSRATYATWMRVVEPAWILPLLVALLGLDMLNGLIGAAVRVFITPSNSRPIPYLFGIPSLLDQIIYGIIIIPFYDLMTLALTVFLIAALMPAGQGSLKARALQVARPYVLARLVLALMSLFISQPEIALRKTALGQNLLGSSLGVIIDLATFTYIFAATLNALAAGSGKNRWLLFAISSLADLVSLAFTWFVLGALLALVGIHLPVAI